jgi:hypothetical protein
MRRRCTLYRDRVPTLDELTGSGPATIDVVLGDQFLLGVRSGPVREPEWSAIAWTDPDDPAPDGCRSWLVDTVVVWGSVDPPAVKQVSLVIRLGGLDAAAFADRYGSHGAVARAHHGMSRYVQNLVAAGPPGLDAVSELCFNSERSWADEFYLQPDSAAIVRDDVRAFIDLRATSSALVAETVVRP